MPDRDILIKVGGACAQGVLTAGIYALARRYAPARSSELSDERLAELRGKYWRFDLACMPLFIAVVALIVWGLYEVLQRIVEWHVARRGPAEFTIREPGAMLLPAVFLALVVAAGPMWALARLLLGAQGYREYVLYCRYGQGFDALRASVLLVVAIVPAALALAALLVDQYALVTRTELVVNPFWEAEHRRPLRDVAAVYEVERVTAPNGTVARQRHHAVRFRDGSTWTTRDGGRTPRARDDAPVARYVAEHAGVTVERVASMPR